MPPKRKRVFYEEPTYGEPDKRLKTSESVDASFQHLNDDISKQILNLLLNSVCDLVALSLTASSWHNKVNNFLNKCIRRFMPLTYNHMSIAERNNKCAGFFKTENHMSNVQIFAYKVDSDEKDELTNNLHIVPWDHNIVVHEGSTKIRLLDLTKENEVLSIETIKWHGRGEQVIAFNEKHELLAVFVHECQKTSLHVYSVNNSQISLKCKDVVEESDGMDASIFIDDDKVVWIMSEGMFNYYSIDQNKFLEQNFLKVQDPEDEETQVTLLSARLATEGVDFYYRLGNEDEDQVPIYVINSVTKCRKEMLRLPYYDYPPTFVWQHNHIVIESIGSNSSHFYVYSRENRPELRLYVSDYNGSAINVSPDGTRFIISHCNSSTNSFDLCEITGLRARDEGNEDNENNQDNEDEENDHDDEDEDDGIFSGSNINDNKFSKKISTITVKKNKCTAISDETRDIWIYRWASKDVIIGLSVDSIAVMDLSTGKTEFESFELPVKAQWVLHGNTVSFVDEKTFLISAYSEQDDLLICKITL